MIIYIDSEFKCHLDNQDNLTQIETDFFNGKCTEFIEGYRFIPVGSTWTREDGVVFRGEMAAPWKPYEALDEAQHDYEQSRLAETEEALEILLGVN